MRLTDKKVKAVIPSASAVRYQFMPIHSGHSSALPYEVRFDAGKKVQRRQARKFHQDAYYVNAYFM